MATPLRLLILEDNPADAELMLHALRRAGYDPIADRAETEQDCRDHLKAAPEIVLSDFSMPEFDALRALEIVQECQLDIPVIIVSGSIGEDLAVEVMQRGAADYLIKDRLERLGHAVTRALEQKRLREAKLLVEQQLLESKELSTAKQREQDAIRQAHEKTVAINEALMIGSLRQQKLTEVAENLNEQLRTEIVERKRAEEAAEEMSRKLADADRGKDEFLAMLAHELRNPLVPIKNAAEILRMIKSPDPVIAKVQSILERQINHITRLVGDLLDTSRIQHRKVTLHTQRLDLASSVLAVLDASRDSIEQNNHALTMDIQNDPPLYIDADPARVAQIVSNLVINAVKYTPDNGDIHVSTGRENGMAVVRVRDNGMGIEPAMLQAVFGLFIQVEVAMDRSQGGLGLGLKLVKELVEMQGGTVEATSGGKGKGSEFIVRFPESAAPIRALPVPREIAPSQSRRILLIDDNADILNLTSMMLTMAGHTVEVANNGVQGVEKALQGAFDIALVDIGLPGMNGYEVANKIREHPGSTGMVLIALTGYGQEEDKRRALEAGFNEHLTKPVDLSVLENILGGLEKYHT